MNELELMKNELNAGPWQCYRGLIDWYTEYGTTEEDRLKIIGYQWMLKHRKYPCGVHHTTINGDSYIWRWYLYVEEDRNSDQDDIPYEMLDSFPSNSIYKESIFGAVEYLALAIGTYITNNNLDS